jgi:hypothetical protein
MLSPDIGGFTDLRYEPPLFRTPRGQSIVKTMKKLAVIVAALCPAVAAVALTAQASTSKIVRVDRPEKGVGARVTHVRLLQGSVPRRVHALVLTDTRCNPDENGVSHCLNRMRLANGHTVLAVHDHMMMRMPCLSPGERVLLTPRSKA